MVCAALKKSSSVVVHWMLLFISLFLALIASNLIAKTTLKGHVPSVCLSSTMCCIMLGGEVFIMCTERILCVIGPSGLSSSCLSLFTWSQACTVCSCPCMAKFEIEFLFISWWSMLIISPGWSRAVAARFEEKMLILGGFSLQVHVSAVLHDWFLQISCEEGVFA